MGERFFQPPMPYRKHAVPEEERWSPTGGQMSVEVISQRAPEMMFAKGSSAEAETAMSPLKRARRLVRGCGFIDGGPGARVFGTRTLP